MVAFILPARTLDSGFNISNSLRFNSGDSARLEKTFGTNTSERKKTFSLWFKRSKLGVYQSLFDTTVTGNVEGGVEITNEDRIQVTDRDATDGTGDIFLPTSMVFRDPSAWYHLVVAMDTTQGTETNRVKVYVNGSQVTSFTTTTYPTQNYDIQSFKSSVANYIGANVSSSYYNGYISEFYFIDGQQLAPTDFGKTNDNGVWIPKEYEGTYGNSGFFQQYKETGTSANSSGMGADTSGNDNHFAATNLAATDVTTDTPQNNFATWNPIAKNPNLPLAEGNTYAENTGTDSFRSALGTIGVSSGKWYWEFRGGPTGDAQKFIVGWTKADVDYNARIFADSNPTVASDGYGYRSDGNKVNNNSASSYGASWNSNTIVGIKLDLDNGTIGFIHGSDRGNAYTGLTTGIFYLPFCALAQASNGEDATSFVNFGNGAHSDFGTNTDANGYGGFTYSVPSGYYALNTKNLAEYG